MGSGFVSCSDDVPDPVLTAEPYLMPMS